MASQITSLAIVYLTGNSGAGQRKYQSSASLAFVQGIHRWPVNSPHKWPVTRKIFPFDDVIIESWKYSTHCQSCKYSTDWLSTDYDWLWILTHLLIYCSIQNLSILTISRQNTLSLGCYTSIRIMSSDDSTHSRQSKIIQLYSQWAVIYEQQFLMTSSNGNIFRVTGLLCAEFTGPHTKPVTRSFDVFFDLRIIKRISKQWWGWWFETQSCPLWRHCIF